MQKLLNIWTKKKVNTSKMKVVIVNCKQDNQKMRNKDKALERVKTYEYPRNVLKEDEKIETESEDPQCSNNTS